jgi:UDP-2,3-diacylglucosamine pyrophosphatase LpxH
MMASEQDHPSGPTTAYGSDTKTAYSEVTEELATDRDRTKLQFRSVFISDIHLGSAGCKVSEVYHFLRAVECDSLFLVGDIFDGWVGAREGKWKQTHANVIRTVLGMSKHGTSVYYCPGNHDSFLRRLNGGDLGNTRIDHSFDHITPAGEKILVIHGDLFDKTITHYHPVAYVSAWAYELVTAINVRVNSRRTKFDLAPVDFTSALKRAAKKIVKRATSYEDALISFAKSEGYAGVICGHVHRPLIDQSENGFVYANCGDWVEHCTALVEHQDGRLELVWWKDLVGTLLPTEKTDEEPLKKVQPRTERNRPLLPGLK